MDDLRRAAQAALEALTNCEPGNQYGHRCNRCDSEIDPNGAVADKLRAALAQPESDDFNRGFQRGWERATKDRDRDAAARVAVEAKLAEKIVSLAQPEQQAEKTCQQCYDEGVRHGAEAERERCAKLCRSLMPPEGVIRRTLLDLERSILDGDAT